MSVPVTHFAIGQKTSPITQSANWGIVVPDYPIPD